ncbi:hypothetical protein TWF730_005724 [Orbilia blumenaviensis]|uniref:Uncharacterized protein n=1 Tax=Orbilia blumenaviensis TaxID=1796055 RepID=A0AAV9VJ67_9PEZI
MWLKNILLFLFLLLRSTLALTIGDESAKTTSKGAVSSPPSFPSNTPAPAKPTNSLRRVIGGKDTDPELMALFIDTPGADGVTWSKREVSSSIFFRWRVVCPTHHQIIGMPKNPDEYPKFKGRRRMDFNKVIDPASSALQARKQCMNCLCTQEGVMIKNPVMPKLNGYWCRQDYMVQRCPVWFNCRCQAEMLQPAIELGISIDDYQNALNNIPSSVKLAFWNYEWKLADRFSMSWQYLNRQEGGGGGNAAEETIELAPGTKEPYYVEGPGGTSWDLEKIRKNSPPMAGGVLSINYGSVLNWNSIEKRSEAEKSA